MKFYCAGLFAAAMTVASAANAEVICQNQDESVKIQTFQLSEDTFGFEPFKVAAILKISDQKVLYTGSALTNPGRVGNTTVYKLVDELGAGIAFSTIETMTFSQCTRVSCNQIIKIVGILEVAGATHNLNCLSSIF